MVLFLDDVRVPKEFLMDPPGEGKALAFPAGETPFTSSVAAYSIGIARAAFEYAVEYAKGRITWGKPMIQHQAVALMLADMQMDLEAARFLVWKGMWLNDYYIKQGKFGTYHSRGSMMKVYATEMAVRVCEKAINVLGCYGLEKDVPLEKYLRDAMAGPITCWQNNMHRIQIAEAL